MPGWTLTTLPTGYTLTHGVHTDGLGAVTGEWYALHGYGHDSGRLNPGTDGFQAALDSFVDASLPASYIAGNQQTLLHERNRWLAQTDPYVLPTGSLPGDMPADVLAAVANPANQAAITTWRQALRDYPGTVTDWSRPPALPSPPVIPLPSGRQLIIVT